jgi:hypothetical protein
MVMSNLNCLTSHRSPETPHPRGICGWFPLKQSSVVVVLLSMPVHRSYPKSKDETAIQASKGTGHRGREATCDES